MTSGCIQHSKNHGRTEERCLAQKLICFFGKETEQHFNLWLSGGCVVFHASGFFFFFFLIPSAWLSSLLQFLLWKRCLFICGNYLLTQEADSKQPVVFLNQNLHLQLVLSWVIEVCFTQFRSWCLQLLACLFESDRNLLTHISCLMLIKGVRSAFSQWCLLH